MGGSSIDTPSKYIASSSSPSSYKFTKGCHVEVTSEEEGFTGAWFLAKVINPSPKSKPNHLFVEYFNLLDDIGTKPLREFVNSDLVRPLPPQEPENFKSYRLNDVVDAFYKDGWWTGVITKVVFDESCKFQVTFSSPPDLLDFGASELRLHRDWVRGKWIRPKKKQGITGLMFSQGKKVEVYLEKAETCEIWFPAIVLEEAENGSFLVEYQCLGANGLPESMKVKVDSLHIRPSPPQLKGKKYVLLEKVDAYIDFGWWSGVITKELPDSKYLIYFKETRKDKLVNQSDLRPHMEWKDGNWFSASQDTPTSPDYNGPAMNVSFNVHQAGMVLPGGPSAVQENSEARAVAYINSLDIRNEWSTPSNMEQSTVMRSQRKKAKLVNPDANELAKTIIPSNKTDLSHLSTDHLNSFPINDPGNGHYGPAISTNGEARMENLEQSAVDVLSDNFSQGRRARYKRQKPLELENHSPDPPKTNSRRPLKSLMSETQTSAGDKGIGELVQHTPEPAGKGKMLRIAQMSGAETSGDKSIEDAVKRSDEKKDCVTETVTVAHNLEKEVIEGSQATILPKIPTVEFLEVSGVQDLAGDRIKLEGHIENTGKRKRGRPKKLSNSSDQQNGSKKLAESPEFNQQNGGAAASAAVDMAIVEVLPVVVGLEATKVGGSVSSRANVGAERKILNSSADMKNKSSSKVEAYPAKKYKQQSRKGLQASVEKLDNGSSKRGRRRTINAECPNQVPEDASLGKMAEVNAKDSLMKEGETLTVRLPNNVSDDEPLSMWLEAPKTADTTSVLQGRTEEQCATFPSQKDVMLSPQCIDRSLPFAKSNFLWQSIDSMEVFRLLPQRPHFRTLCSKKESSREGLAIALMVDFVNVVEKTTTLQCNVERNIIEDYLETIIELEENGFDVKVVRDRLTHMLLIKEEQERLQVKAKENVDMIKEERDNKVKVDKNIEEIDNQMRLLQEQRALLLSTKVGNDSAIASLELTGNSIDDSIKNVNLKFESLAAAPWHVP